MDVENENDEKACINVAKNAQYENLLLYEKYIIDFKR